MWKSLESDLSGELAEPSPNGIDDHNKTNALWDKNKAQRHSLLIDRKLTEGLTSLETAELTVLGEQLDAYIDCIAFSRLEYVIKVLKDVKIKLGQAAGDKEADELWNESRSQRRGLLLKRKLAGTLTSLEAAELAQLTEWLDAYVDHVAPLPAGTECLNSSSITSSHSPVQNPH